MGSIIVPNNPEKQLLHLIKKALADPEDESVSLLPGTVVGGSVGSTGGGGGGSGIAVRIDQTPAGVGMSYGTLSGLVNGSNTTFTTSAGVYASGQLEVERNGQGVSQGSDQTWVETDPSAGTFDFVTAPLATDHIKVRYNT